MGEQVLGGGVIVLVAVLLWMVYLLPTWAARHRFNASEKNAVRLNQALRVLASTSETPGEVELELTARTALAQQKLARRMQAEKEQAELEELRFSLDIARQAPAARRVRARRRVRIVSSLVVLAGLCLIAFGVVQTVLAGIQLWLWVGTGVAAAGSLLLARAAYVQHRAAVRVAVTAAETGEAPSLAPGRRDVQDVELDSDGREWMPRALPRPLASAAGSRASAELDAAEARAALRQATREQRLRERAEALRPSPVPISVARSSDAEIEAHVRDLLARRQRASGE